MRTVGQTFADMATPGAPRRARASLVVAMGDRHGCPSGDGRARVRLLIKLFEH
jgi:hypothetical protein